jgi:parvulin-like peptidyl-prolyl isomerase
MKRTALLVFTAFSALFAQQPAAPAASTDDVVAVIEGKPWKRGELESLVRALPDSVRINYQVDKRAFLKTFALTVRLATMAESEGIDKQIPHAQRLFYNRLLYLATVRLGNESEKLVNNVAEVEKHYNENKSKYASAKVKVVQIAFNDTPGKTAAATAKRPLSSAEAEDRAREVVKQARSGVSFPLLVAKYSDDADSKAHAGDYPPIKFDDKTLPAGVKAAIFGLRPGDVTEPIRQAGAFWIFRMTEYVTPAFAEVKDRVGKDMQDEQLHKWVEALQQDLKIEFKNAAYLDEKTTLQ